MTHFQEENRLIVALDTPTIEEAEAIVLSLGPHVGFYKIGYQLAPIGGFDFARRLKAVGKKVFLDLKYHDIGATVEKGVRSVRETGADLLTVHATPTVVRAAVEGRGDDENLKILAVTVLTDQSPSDLAASFGAGADDIDLPAIVAARAEMAIGLGADGVVASPMEAAALRAQLGPEPLIVTPGVRPAGAGLDDQKRVATPAEAIKSGASHLVVGRPITAADDPAAAAAAIAAEIEGL
ncbi:MAG: orotidine-5'-phosphate decarboxylase [Pseudomonadota bacterium]